MIVDTHTHLYLAEFDEDREAMMHRAKSAGIERFYLPGINSEVIPAMMAMEAAFPAECRLMMGLHPCYVNERMEEELKLVEDWLAKRPFAAVGEIGLDFYWDRQFEAQQYRAFDRQMDLAKAYHLPIVIHTRNAMQETINRVKAKQDGGLTGIFHCFSGSYESAREIIKLGFFLGIGGVVTYKNAGLESVLKQVPLTHLVLETDAPYLTPVPFRGKRNESAYLQYVIDKLAAIYEVSTAEIVRVTTSNAEKIFGS
jgi:TatD DNase family protein